MWPFEYLSPSKSTLRKEQYMEMLIVWPQRNILRTWRGVNPFPIPYRTPSAKVCAIPATVALVLLALQFVFILLDALRSHINEGFLRRPRALPRPPKVGKIMAQYLKKAIILHTLGVQVWGVSARLHDAATLRRACEAAAESAAAGTKTRAPQ